MSRIASFEMYRSRKRAWVVEKTDGRKKVVTWWKPKRSNEENKRIGVKRTAERYEKKKAVEIAKEEKVPEKKFILYDGIFYINYKDVRSRTLHIEIEFSITKPEKMSEQDALNEIQDDIKTWLQSTGGWISDYILPEERRCEFGLERVTSRETEHETDEKKMPKEEKSRF